MPLIHDYTPNSTLIVRLISTAQTGFFYTTQRLRTGPKLAAVKYDPRGTSLSPHNVTSSFCPVLSLSLSCLVPPNRRYHLTQGSQRPFVHTPSPSTLESARVRIAVMPMFLSISSFSGRGWGVVCMCARFILSTLPTF